MWQNWKRRARPALLGKLYRRSPLPCWRPRYRLRDKQSAEYSILSVEPPIFVAAYWIDERLTLYQSMTPLFDYLADTRAYFFYKWYWWIEEPHRIEDVKRFEQHHHRRYPKHQIIHLCNTPKQYEVFCDRGLNAIFCNENALLDEKLFYPLPDIPKQWDAVYDARFKDYKRHELALRVSSLALIYDVNPYVDDLAYVERVRGQFRHAHFFNHDANGAYIKLTPPQLNEAMNNCRVGLCLSAVEGGNASSMQYLLCGLPVVSTHSRGGRDVFFHPDYALIVDDTGEAVRDGVQKMIKRSPAAEQIRSRTLEARASHRQTLIDAIQGIYDREGVPRRFAADWETVYFNKLVRQQRHADTFARLDIARRNGVGD